MLGLKLIMLVKGVTGVDLDDHDFGKLDFKNSDDLKCFALNYHTVVFNYINAHVNLVTVGSGNGLTPNRQQTITWTHHCIPWQASEWLSLTAFLRQQTARST